jgi:pantoate--beta-alanine ligase
MTVIRSAARMAAFARRLERQGRRVGLVPTMGALHDGHASLIRRAAAENDVAVVTIFVNPLQFGPSEDYRRYPRTLQRDVKIAGASGADIVFAPSARGVYPPGFQTRVVPGELARRWEGASRPGHFQGVATVVAILFELTRPANAYVGRKDYQQSLVVRHLIRDLRLPIRLHVLPTMRERDGLAMSSRNAYLSAAERRQARALFEGLRAAASRIRAGERRAPAIAAALRARIRRERGVALEYAAVADAETLEPLRRLRRGRAVVLVAARVGRTRLIDNLLVDVP